jgi:hypothetical protein
MFFVYFGQHIDRATDVRGAEVYPVAIGDGHNKNERRKFSGFMLACGFCERPRDVNFLLM